MTPYMITEESCMSNRIKLLCGWGYVDSFGESINADPDAVIALTAREVRDQVNSDILPAISWHFVGHQLSSRGCREDLGPVTAVTAFDIVGNISRDTWPPEVPCHKLECLPAS